MSANSSCGGVSNATVFSKITSDQMTKFGAYHKWKRECEKMRRGVPSATRIPDLPLPPGMTDEDIARCEKIFRSITMSQEAMQHTPEHCSLQQSRFMSLGTFYFVYHDDT